MTDKEPNSRRYWRLNSIQALTITAAHSLYETSHPDDYAALMADRRELTELKKLEAAVRARHARRFRRAEL